MSGTIHLPTGDTLIEPSGNGSIVTPGAPTNVNLMPADLSGRMFATGGTAPTVAAGANNGTTPPAPTVAGVDMRGTATFGSGATPAAGAQVVVTFSSAYSSAPVVVVSAANAATAALNVFPTSVTTTGFTISSAVAPTASQAATAYSAAFIICG